jgi:hypothetical protein
MAWESRTQSGVKATQHQVWVLRGLLIRLQDFTRHTINNQQHSFYSWLCCAFFMLRRCCASAAAPVSGELTRIVSPFATFGVQALPAAPIQAHAIQQDELKLLRDDYANGVPLNSSAQHVNC